LGLIDRIVAEPEPSAAADPEGAAEALRTAIGGALSELSGIGPRRLLDERARKLRQLGLATPEGREIALSEVRELQDLQRLLERSLDELRQKVEHRLASLPGLHGIPALQRPAISLPRINVRRPDLAEFAQRVSASRRTRRVDEPEARTTDDEAAG
jgi:hypothetical protein